MKPTFQRADDRPGVTVVDPIQNKQFPLETSARPTVREISPDGFHFPVEAAVTVSTSRLVLPYVVPTYVRDRDGSLLLESEHYAYETLSADEYLLELMAPIRLYVHADSAVTITSSDERMAFDFGEPTTVRLGARSHHERPASVVETTAEPTDLARAISTFGSALKTTSPERSLPSLRGHPPRLEVTDRVHVPPEIDVPETGITIVVPPDRTAVYAASSLAFYLGARVVTGSNPRLETDDGFEYRLGESGEAFERSLERLFQHVFFLECVVRTEGFYQVDLHERRRLEERVDVPFADLYEAPIAARLEGILSVSFETIEDLLPTWRLVTYVTDEPENANALSFLANDLSLVRATPSAERDQTAAKPSVSLDIDEFTRSIVRSGDDRSDRSESADSHAGDTYVSPPETGTLERAWLGAGIPIGVNKLVHSAFDNGIDRSPAAGEIEITIVCNDARMAAELDGELYGGRDELPFDVTVHENLSVDELRTLLSKDVDFLHYVGHVEDDAFVCRDGALDARTLQNVGVDTFLLNGCLSYEIGVRLVEAGSVGGIVTLSEVGNPDAIAVGRLIARLLNTGYTLRTAVSLARSYRFVGNQYIVVGDGSTVVTQAGGGVPNHCRIESGDQEGEYRVQLRLYHSAQSPMGALYIPYIDGVDRHFLVGGELPAFTLSAEALYRFLRLERIPVEFDGEFCWSTDERFTSL